MIDEDTDEVEVQSVSLLRSHVRIPERFMLIEEAITAIGNARYREAWTRNSYLPVLPFHFSDYGHLIRERLSDDGKYSIKSVNTKAEPENAHQARAARRYNSVICANILQAWERKQFKIHLIHPTMGVLPHLSESVVHLQYNDMFKFGRGHAAPEPNHMRFLIVVIERQPFIEWLSRGAEGYRDTVETTGKVIRRKAPQRVVDVLIEFLKQADTKVTREWLWELLSESVQPQTLSKKAFLDDVWRRFPTGLKHRGNVDLCSKQAATLIRSEALATAMSAAKRGI